MQCLQRGDVIIQTDSESETMSPSVSGNRESPEIRSMQDMNKTASGCARNNLPEHKSITHNTSQVHIVSIMKEIHFFFHIVRVLVYVGYTLKLIIIKIFNVLTECSSSAHLGSIYITKI